jgi:hypothetical protein
MKKPKADKTGYKFRIYFEENELQICRSRIEGVYVLNIF